MIVTILAFLFVFGLLVFVHELGHYLSARLFKVKVEEFAFGFPPRLWSKKKGDTVYSINALPLGGYVRLLGESWEDSKSKDSLVNKKPWQKVVILASGVIMNILLAWILLTGFYIFGGAPVVPKSWEHTGVENNLRVYFTEVESGKAAAGAGINNEDLLTAVNGTKVYRHQEAIELIDKAIEADNKKPISFSITRDGGQLDKSFVPFKDGSEVEMGFALENRGSIKAKWYLSPLVAGQELLHISALTFEGFGEFFRILFTKFKVSESVGGPIAIFQLSGTAANMGPAIFVQFIVLLSVSLAIMNIMPFPALDGGHIAFIIVEKLRGKEITREVKERIIKWGFGFLLLLVAIVSVNDIIRSGAFDFVKGIFKK